MDLSPDRLLDQTMLPVPPFDRPVDEPGMAVTAVLFAAAVTAVPAAMATTALWALLAPLAGVAAVFAHPYVRNRIKAIDLTGVVVACVALVAVAAGRLPVEAAEAAGVFLLLIAATVMILTRMYGGVAEMVANLLRKAEMCPEGRPLEAVLSEMLGAAAGRDIAGLLDERRGAGPGELRGHMARGFFRPRRILKPGLVTKAAPNLHPGDVPQALASMTTAATWIARAQADRHRLTDRQFVRLADGYKQEVAATLARHVPQPEAEPAT
jgi:hypothetical protein